MEVNNRCIDVNMVSLIQILTVFGFHRFGLQGKELRDLVNQGNLRTFIQVLNFYPSTAATIIGSVF